jgi:serpin B
MRQTCAVEVDEEGTTAVAATYSFLSPTGLWSPPPPPMSFVADHPFMFAIVEYEKAELLFLGHVMDPSKEDCSQLRLIRWLRSLGLGGRGFIPDDG